MARNLANLARNIKGFSEFAVCKLMNSKVYGELGKLGKKKNTIYTHSNKKAFSLANFTIDDFSFLAKFARFLAKNEDATTMPMIYENYPSNWKEISVRVRFDRAKGKCEWCEAEHFGIRADGTGHAFTLSEVQELAAEGIYVKGTRIILTVAHLGIDKPDGTPGDKADTMDCREENLAALCQRCHLGFDREDHVRSRRINRRLRLVAAGQLEMF